jgi:hypothetical protein
LGLPNLRNVNWELRNGIGHTFEFFGIFRFSLNIFKIWFQIQIKNSFLNKNITRMTLICRSWLFLIFVFFCLRLFNKVSLKRPIIIIKWPLFIFWPNSLSIKLFICSNFIFLDNGRFDGRKIANKIIFKRVQVIEPGLV